MPSRDTGKWVQRAASTGGGRTYRGQMPVKWYGSLVMICLLGVTAVVYSRYERQHPVSGPAPTVGTTWHAALAFDLCGTLQPSLPANANLSGGSVPGIRTDGGGVVLIAPTAAKDAGSNATLAQFVHYYPKLTLTSSKLQLPGSREYRNGQACPPGTPDAGRPGSVRIAVWSSFSGAGSQHSVTYIDPAAVKFANGQLITAAFVPSGASVPKPSAQTILALLQAESGTSNPSTASTVPSLTTPTTSPSTTSPSTTAPTTSTTKAK